MVSRFLRPIFSWGQDAARVAPLAFVASVRGSLLSAVNGLNQQQQYHQHEQRRHRWAGTNDFGGNEQAAMDFLNEGAQYEGLVKRWSARKYYIKPFVQRKQRYNRWVRRRSLEKINNLLERVRHEKARGKVGNPRLGDIYTGKAEE